MNGLIRAYSSGMVLHNKRKQRAAAVLCGLLLGIVAIWGGITAGYAEKEVEREGITVFLKQESGDVCTVILSPMPKLLTEGRAMAFLFTLELSKDTRFVRAETCGSGGGLHLTVGNLSENRVSILMDGYMGSDTEQGAILRIYVDGAGGYMGITAVKSDELAIYCLDESGECIKIPVEICRETDTEAHDDVSETQDDTSESPIKSETTSEETSGHMPPCTEEKGQTEPTTHGDEDMIHKEDRFMGCRETAPRNGVFSVQFLFYGSNRETPVICMEGGGTVTLLVEYGVSRLSEREGISYGRSGGEGWEICTFRGLSVKNRYVFLIYTDGKTVRVVYENGAFVGYR